MPKAAVSSICRIVLVSAAFASLAAFVAPFVLLIAAS